MGLGFGYVATRFSIFKGFGLLAVLGFGYLVWCTMAGQHGDKGETG